jgi:hypothetical protein
MNRSPGWKILLMLLLAGCAPRTKASLSAADQTRDAGEVVETAVSRDGDNDDAVATNRIDGDGNDDSDGNDDGAPAATAVIPDAAGNADDADTGSAGCAALCTKLAGAHCPADDVSSCTAQCQSVIGDACGPAYQRLAACSLERPLTDFHCEDGNAILNQDVCLAEQQAWADCLVFGP